eukprot:c7554_g1_i3.p1 GENE.c7554_g1_i3~~c7554_g1_i3.p1  ORF type:complete len:171 (+),score=23.98 c7554_g1_i3:28-540(+)
MGQNEWRELYPLHHAALRRYDKVAYNLVKSGRDLNELFCGWTPLHFAADYNQIDICVLLLCYGTDRSIKDRDNKTARDVAVHNRRTKVVELFDTITPEVAAGLLAITDRPTARHLELFKWYMFCLGMHSRLGSDSAVRLLNEDLLRLSFSFLLPPQGKKNTRKKHRKHKQ